MEKVLLPHKEYFIVLLKIYKDCCIIVTQRCKTPSKKNQHILLLIKKVISNVVRREKRGIKYEKD